MLHLLKVVGAGAKYLQTQTAGAQDLKQRSMSGLH